MLRICKAPLALVVCVFGVLSHDFSLVRFLGSNGDLQLAISANRRFPLGRDLKWVRVLGFLEFKCVN